MTRLEALFAPRAARIGVILAWLFLGGVGGEPSTLPLKTLTELGFTIALGVLLDTFIVRSLLVPALVFDTVAARAMADAGRWRS